MQTFANICVPTSHSENCHREIAQWQQKNFSKTQKSAHLKGISEIKIALAATPNSKVTKCYIMLPELYVFTGFYRTKSVAPRRDKVNDLT